MIDGGAYTLTLGTMVQLDPPDTHVDEVLLTNSTGFVCAVNNGGGNLQTLPAWTANIFALYPGSSLTVEAMSAISGAGADNTLNVNWALSTDLITGSYPQSLTSGSVEVTGPVAIAGSIEVAGDVSLAAGSTVALAAGSEVSVAGPITGTVAISGDVSLAAGGTVAIAGPVGITGPVELAAGTQVAVSGAVTVAAINNPISLANGTIVEVAAGTTVDVVIPPNSVIGVVNQAGSNLAVSVPGTVEITGAVTLAAGATVSISGPVGITGPVSLAAGSTVAVTGTVNAQINNPVSLASGTVVEVASGSVDINVPDGTTIEVVNQANTQLSVAGNQTLLFRVAGVATIPAGSQTVYVLAAVQYAIPTGTRSVIAFGKVTGTTVPNQSLTMTAYGDISGSGNSQTYRSNTTNIASVLVAPIYAVLDANVVLSIAIIGVPGTYNYNFTGLAVPDEAVLGVGSAPIQTCSNGPTDTLSGQVSNAGATIVSGATALSVIRIWAFSVSYAGGGGNQYLQAAGGKIFYLGSGGLQSVSQAIPGGLPFTIGTGSISSLSTGTGFLAYTIIYSWDVYA